jgi:threonine/homoserine/homoserine lactone efflux protein
VRWQALASLVVASLAIMGTPGPATISLTAAGSAHGVRRSLGYLAGIVAGTTVVLLAVATGITAALLAVPAVRPVLLAISAGYILWLAYHIATAPPLAAEGASRDAPGLAGGLVLGVANPKAWVAIAAVFAGSRLASGTVADASGKVAVLTAMILLINASWLGIGAALAAQLREPRTARAVNVVLAAALVASLVVVVRG